MSQCKSVRTILFLLGMATFFCACSGGDGALRDAVAGKTFVWEKEGFGGEFRVQIKRDGTYEYYEGILSSYIGRGEWSLEEDVLTLTEKDGYDFVFRFQVKDGELHFLQDGSDRFIYCTVEDGDRFIADEKLNHRHLHVVSFSDFEPKREQKPLKPLFYAAFRGFIGEMDRLRVQNAGIPVSEA